MTSSKLDVLTSSPMTEPIFAWISRSFEGESNAEPPSLTSVTMTPPTPSPSSSSRMRPSGFSSVSDSDSEAVDVDDMSADADDACGSDDLLAAESTCVALGSRPASAIDGAATDGGTTNEWAVGARCSSIRTAAAPATTREETNDDDDEDIIAVEFNADRGSGVFV
mmetsp:Transcript_33096/g.80064  ORF Transcript_33096/g.80064 Transcript_33096/m.80064 type:complete len:166 (+) Transcript_33096:677-1174(+)